MCVTPIWFGFFSKMFVEHLILRSHGWIHFKALGAVSADGQMHDWCIAMFTCLWFIPTSRFRCIDALSSEHSGRKRDVTTMHLGIFLYFHFLRSKKTEWNWVFDSRRNSTEEEDKNLSWNNYLTIPKFSFIKIGIFIKYKFSKLNLTSRLGS